MASRKPDKGKGKQNILQIAGVGLQGLSSPTNSVQTIVVPHTKNPEVGSAKLAKKAKTIEQLFAERSKLPQQGYQGPPGAQDPSGNQYSVSVPDPSDSDGHDPKGLERFSSGKPLGEATAADFLMGLTTTSGSPWEGFDINTKDATGRVRLNELKREALKMSWDAHAQARKERREAFQDQWSVEGAAARRRARGQSQPQEPQPRTPTQEELVAEALAAVASGDEKACSFGGFYGLDSKGKYHKFSRQSDFYGGCSRRPRSVRADVLGGAVNMGANFADDPRRKALKEQWAANDAARQQHNAEVKQNFDRQWSVEAAAARKPPQPTQKELVADAIAALDANYSAGSGAAAGTGTPSAKFTPDPQNTVAANNPPKQHNPVDFTKIEPQGQAEIAKALAVKEGYLDKDGNLTPEREAAMQKEMAENPDKTIGYLWGVRQDKIGQMESRIQNRVNNDRINDFNKANIEAARRGEGQGWSSNRSAIKAPGHTESDAEWEKAWDNALSGNEGKQMRDAIDGRIDTIQNTLRAHKGDSEYQQRASKAINRLTDRYERQTSDFEASSIYGVGAPETKGSSGTKDVMDFTPSKPISYPFGSTLANGRTSQLRDRADYKGLESRGAGFFTGPSKLPSASKSAGSMKPSATSLATRKHNAAREFIRGVEEQRNFERKNPKVVGWGKDYNDSLIRDMRQGVEKEVGASSSLAARKSTAATAAQDFIERAKEQWDLFNKEKGADRRSNDRFNSALRPYPYRNDRFNSALRPNPRAPRKDDQRDPRKDWSFDWFRRVSLR